MHRLIGTTVCNLLWFLNCLPGTLAFLFSLCFPRRAQQRIMRRIVRRNAQTDVGQRYDFAHIESIEDYATVPVSEYADYAAAIDLLRKNPAHTGIVADRVRVLEPTSGTGNAPKLIPYTSSLKREFLAAIHPWIAGLYLLRPSLFLGRQYWSISPNTQATDVVGDAGGVPVGFEDDAAYLGGFGRWLSRRLMVPPSGLARVTDPRAFVYLTLLFLVKEPNLRLVSVWHPSFLTILLDALPAHWPDLVRDVRSGRIPADLNLPPEVQTSLQTDLRPDPRRAAQLSSINPSQPHGPALIWTRLRVISCWTRGCEAWMSRLTTWFPGATIQAKGLVATEGIVTIPLGSHAHTPAAVRSHFFEFLDRTTGDVKRLWELAADREYIVLLTTGGGLYRYCLHDRVCVDGYLLRTPYLRFNGREGCVSDMVGEKVDLRLAEQAIANAQGPGPHTFDFAMLAPEHRADGRCGYVCYVRAAAGITPDWEALTDHLEQDLQTGYHYLHARRLKQLEPLQVFELTGVPDIEYREHCARNGMRRGDVKFVQLSLHSDWRDVFQGRIVAIANQESRCSS